MGKPSNKRRRLRRKGREEYRPLLSRDETGARDLKRTVVTTPHGVWTTDKLGNRIIAETARPLTDEERAALAGAVRIEADREGTRTVQRGTLTVFVAPLRPRMMRVFRETWASRGLSLVPLHESAEDGFLPGSGERELIPLRRDCRGISCFLYSVHGLKDRGALSEEGWERQCSLVSALLCDTRIIGYHESAENAPRGIGGPDGPLGYRYWADRRKVDGPPPSIVPDEVDKPIRRRPGSLDEIVAYPSADELRPRPDATTKEEAERIPLLPTTKGENAFSLPSIVGVNPEALTEKEIGSSRAALEAERDRILASETWRLGAIPFDELRRAIGEGRADCAAFTDAELRSIIADRAAMMERVKVIEAELG